jgi:hypothetical protein
VIDPGYGVRANQPNVVTHHHSPREYDVRITTNSAGMRGRREYSVEKPPGVRRVCLLGDSFVFGFGVNDEEVVGAVLEDALRARGRAAGPRYEVLNFAVSGFGQAEELVTYRHKVRGYGPDVVVLFYFDNDVANNVMSDLFAVGEDGELLRTGRAYLPGVHAREVMYRIAPIRFLFTHSRVWNLIRNRLSARVQYSLLERHGMKEFDEANAAALALTRALLRTMIEEVRADGAWPIVFIIPSRKMETNFPLTEREVRAAGAASWPPRTTIGGIPTGSRRGIGRRPRRWRGSSPSGGDPCPPDKCLVSSRRIRSSPARSPVGGAHRGRPRGRP